MSVTIRPATIDHADCHFVYHLAMDESVRLASTRSELFAFAEHCEWFERRIADPLTRFFILEADGERVGYVRWGNVPDTKDWEVSVAVSPAHRRKGYALSALASKPDGRAVALVVVDNAPSLALFEAAGYARVGTEERMGKQHVRFEQP